jgi:hypothetical protein
MNMREWAEEIVVEVNPDAFFMDDLDEAIIGVTAGQAGQETLVVYDQALIIEKLIADGATEEEAWDHYGFNIQGAYVGPNTPVIIVRPMAGDLARETADLE